MNKNQPIKFTSLEDFMAFLPDGEYEIVSVLRNLILGYLPYCNEKLAYNVPYYYINKRVLFIWPSSIPWGKVSKGGVTIGFCKGHLIIDEIGFLEKGNRKEVYTKTYFSVDEIDINLLKLYIFRALEIDKI